MHFCCGEIRYKLPEGIRLTLKVLLFIFCTHEKFYDSSSISQNTVAMLYTEKGISVLHNTLGV